MVMCGAVCNFESIFKPAPTILIYIKYNVPHIRTLQLD